LKILILDNYDSFTYNLYDYVASFEKNVEVKRNDAISLEEIEAYSHIILSPGPKLPKDAGMMPTLIESYVFTKKILGICLGMQALGAYFGAELYNLNQPKHGVAVNCKQVNNCALLKDVSNSFEVGLYHSWAIRNVKSPLKVTCKSEENVIMGIQHEKLPVYGFQFHPESILTPEGKKIIQNFLEL
jgi:anthranilate synthase component 2